MKDREGGREGLKGNREPERGDRIKSMSFELCNLNYVNA